MSFLSNIHLHPALVHFPVALFISAFLFESLSLILKKEILHTVAVAVYILATVTTPFTAYSGLWEAQRLNLHHPVLDTHRTFALITMYVSFMSLFVIGAVRKLPVKIYRTIFFIFSLMMIITVTVTAYNGGRMVYEYGVGING